MSAIEICLASKIPDSVQKGSHLTLDLLGIMSSAEQLDKVQIHRKSFEIFIDAYAKSNSGVGITSGWQKQLKIKDLTPGLYTLRFNHKFGHGSEWDKTVTVQ